MTDIHVFLTKKKGSEQDLVMTHEQQPVIQKDMIFWHFQSDHPGVEEVKIAFDKSDALFFDYVDEGQLKRKNWYQKKLVSMDSSQAADQQGQQNKKPRRFTRSAVIWAKAPMFAEDSRDDKYTISGLDKQGATVIELDPIIITDRPRP